MAHLIVGAPAITRVGVGFSLSESAYPAEIARVMTHVGLAIKRRRYVEKKHMILSQVVHK